MSSLSLTTTTDAKQQQLVPVLADPAQMALVVSMLQSAQVPNLRRRRDAFEMVADRKHMDTTIKIASYLNALQYYRRGADRWRVFTYGFLYNSFNRALHELKDDEGRSAAENGFNIDTWYYELLPVETRLKEDLDGGIESSWQLASIGKDQGDHSVDWVHELQKLDEQYPGILVALESLVIQQTSQHENVRINYEAAQHYMRGDEPLARMGSSIRKAGSQQQHAMSTGGGMFAGRVLGQWSGGGGA